MSIALGNAAQTRHIVQENQLALHWGGALPVLASPVLIGLIETACMAATDEFLEDGQITAGFGFALQHLAPSLQGSEISISVKVVEISGRKITYVVSASDSHGIIANGHHVRAIIDRRAFQSKLRERIESSPASKGALATGTAPSYTVS